MSKESAKTFFEKVVDGKIAKVDSEENFFAVVKESGFHFSKEDRVAISQKNSDG